MSNKMKVERFRGTFEQLEDKLEDVDHDKIHIQVGSYDDDKVDVLIINYDYDDDD